MHTSVHPCLREIAAAKYKARGINSRRIYSLPLVVQGPSQTGKSS